MLRVSNLFIFAVLFLFVVVDCAPLPRLSHDLKPHAVAIGASAGNVEDVNSVEEASSIRNMRKQAEYIDAFIQAYDASRIKEQNIPVVERNSARFDRILLEESEVMEAGAGIGFTLRDVNQGHCMDVQASKTRVIMYPECHGKPNQRWYWVGHTIRSKLAENLCLTVSSLNPEAEAIIAPCVPKSPEQMWFVHPKTREIRNSPHGNAGSCLEADDNWWTDEAELRPCSGGKDQQWEAFGQTFTAPKYNADEIRRAAQLAAAAYCEADIIQEGDAGVLGGLSAQNLKLVKFIAHPESDLEGYVAMPKDGDKSKSLVVGVRGTASGTDAWIDLQFFPADPVLDDGTKIAHYANAKVHTGFLKQLKGLHPDMMAALKPLVAQGYTKIMVTGHSLGGAVATLASMDLFHNLKAADGKRTFVQAGGSIRVFTFGSPRAANDDYTYEFNVNMVNSFRVVNDQDPVPCLPQEFLGFDHVNSQLWYDGTTWKYNINQYDVCGWSPNTAVGDHMMGDAAKDEGYRGKLVHLR